MKRCKSCGKLVDITNHAWYCADCKELVQKERRKCELEVALSKNKEGICVICGATFSSYFKKETCSKACSSELRSRIKQGYCTDEITKEKIGSKNCIEWHIVSPEGKHYEFENLSKWAFENCALFGFEQARENGLKVASGLSGAKRTMLGVNAGGVTTYKDWKVVIVYGPNEICALYKNGMSVDKIRKISKISVSKIRKVLISQGLWKNDLTENIKSLMEDGKSIEEISNILNISTRSVHNYTPYSKGIYGYKLSPNAMNLKKWKAKKLQNPID